MIARELEKERWGAALPVRGAKEVDVGRTVEEVLCRRVGLTSGECEERLAKLEALCATVAPLKMYVPDLQDLVEMFCRQRAMDIFT
jgi:hypothetical protein